MCNNITWVSMEYLLSVGEDLELESLRLNGNRIGPVVRPNSLLYFYFSKYT